MKIEDVLTKLTEEAKAKIADCKNADEILKILAENGIDISKLDVQGTTNSNAELSDDDLAAVTGGSGLTDVIQKVLRYGIEQLTDAIKDNMKKDK